MRVLNVFDADLHVDDEPAGYRAPYTKVREHIGADRMGGTVVLLGKNEAVCPYHYELVEEEWLFVLDGTPSVRTPTETEELEAGDIVCFPRGPEGAHKIFNVSDTPARILIISERALCAATVYEDSDKAASSGRTCVTCSAASTGATTGTARALT